MLLLAWWKPKVGQVERFQTKKKLNAFCLRLDFDIS
jgi:hypothetical protein